MVDARKPAAAGVFYPSERDTLARVVRELLDAASQPELPESHSRAVRAIVVPHGLYASAGPVMAAGWSSVAAAASRIRRIVLLGPAHHMPFLGLAAPYADAFATPLGVVPVDRIAIETTRRFPQLAVSDVPYEGEHSLEVQLPFVQTVLPSATIVPLLVGDATDEESTAILETLWDKSTLVVVSTDLSRYYEAGAAERLDEATARAIEEARTEPIGEEEACGHSALRALLVAARARGFSTVRAALRHVGEKEEVLGFGSFVVTGPST